MPRKAPTPMSKAKAIGKAVVGAATAPARAAAAVVKKGFNETSAPPPPPLGKYRGKTSATRG